MTKKRFGSLRVRTTGLSLGDKNTKVFHGCARTRKMKNSIATLRDPGGVEHTEKESKGEIVVNYFESLFQTSQPAGAAELLEGMTARVTDTMNDRLTREVTDADIKKAMKSIKSDSSPGADGMTSHFFQRHWHHIGPAISKEVNAFFRDGVLPSEWNFTQLVLLPKKPNPTQMSDLRPISLCSVTYKIISKVLCMRLKGVLPYIVSSTKGAIVAGRLI